MTDDQLRRLIDNYLNKTASAGELAALEQWYEQQQLKPGPFGNQEERAMTAFHQQVLAAVHTNIEAQEAPVSKLRRSTLLLRRTAIAASVLLIVTTGILISRRAATDQPYATTIQPSATATPLALIRNNTPGDSLINLEDGTHIVLASNSSIRYEKPFAANKRTIYLEGKAFFKVAKDASRPFTVYSRSISTTALGTAFTITAFETAAAVNVQLHEGKVVIRSAENNKLPVIPDTYLKAGQELAYTVKTHSVAVQYSNKAAGTMVKNNTPSLPAGQHTGMEASFEQEPLVNVLQQMEQHYHATISFDKAALADMEFSGNIHARDSMGYVLQRIAVLHQLTITRTREGYLIRKNQ